MKTIYKPWGKEEWLELNEFYCYKRIYLNAGHKTSFQYHEQKYETNYIISGTAEVWLEDNDGNIQKTIMTAGEYFNVAPPKKHRVIALTDVILQEVSTPHVDDVIRIEDDANRPNGKILTEHTPPAVLILCAGLGTRLHPISKIINKVLVPIKNKAVISHIIDQFPIEYPIVITLGYMGNVIKEYCEIAHADRNIEYVFVDDFTSPTSGPGYSALQAKHLLQKPFYFITGDCLLENNVPLLVDNWLGVTPTEFPEKYSTVHVVNDKVVGFENKSRSGYENAFIGFAGIVDYETFWSELETNIYNGEIVSAFNNPSAYKSLTVKQLSWFDTGNIDDLNKAKQFFKDQPLSLSKNINEFTYKVKGKFIKYFENIEKVKNLAVRSSIITDLIPPTTVVGTNFISYDWIDGDTLYAYDDELIFEKFLNTLKQNLNVDEYTSPNDVINFYKNKTETRVNSFISRFDKRYFQESFWVNGKSLPSMEDCIKKLNIIQLENTPLYKNFHGDLQFENIIYNDKHNFYYIDWRENFGENTQVGDKYYDLAKLLGGLLIPYNQMKDDMNVSFVESQYKITYHYSVTANITKFLKTYEQWLLDNNFDLKKVYLITGIIFLNMSPLHDEKFSKMLWFKALEILNEYNN